jgi:hypothetical protein
MKKATQHAPLPPSQAAIPISKHHELHGLNTELAVSGNSELARIRLIISYMTEANAILFIATFLFWFAIDCAF